MALSDNLISYWKFDETSGDANDSHGSNHLTPFGTIPSVIGVINGGRDCTFSAGDSFGRADNPSVSMGANTSFTIQAWVKFESYPAAGGAYQIFGKWVGPSNTEYILYFSGDTHTIAGLITGTGVFGDGFSQVQNLTSVTLGVWYLVHFWYDQPFATLGMSINAGTPATATGSIYTCYDGTASLTVGNIDGVIDEVALWKRVLTGAERTELWNSGAGAPYWGSENRSYAVGAGANSLQYGTPVNWSHPLNRGLMARWQVLPGQMGGKYFLDLCSRCPEGHPHALLQSSMIPATSASGMAPTTRRSGVYGNSFGELRLDGTDDYAYVGGVASLGGFQQFSICVWVKILGEHDDNSYIISRANLSVPNHAYALIYRSGPTSGFAIHNTFQSFVYDGTNAQYMSGTTTPGFGSWYHLQFSYDGVTSKMYINGVLENSLSSPSVSPLDSVGTLVLGCYANLSSLYNLNGAIDDVRIFNRALSPTEMSALHWESKKREDRTLNWIYPMAYAVPYAPSTGVSRVWELGTKLTDGSAVPHIWELGPLGTG